MKYKQYILFMLFLSTCYIARGQTLSPKVMPSAGGISTAGGNTLSWTMGQPFSTTLSGGGNDLSQGFQQPEILLTTSTITGSPFCQGASVTVAYIASGYFDNTNVFTAQLSDASGSFSSPVSIGTATTNVSGNITATIPSNASAGSGYRIRVVSSKPSFIGVSNSSNLTIVTNVSPSVSLGASSNTICNGTNVTFTATPTNGGGAPTYNFFLNGVSAQNSSSASYSNSSLVSGDSVYVVMSANNSCQTSATATSLAEYITVTTPLTPSVSVSVSSTTVCSGITVNFTASPTNGGTPSYVWKKNSTTVGTNSSSLNISTLASGDTIKCIMTSSLGCVTTSTATSNISIMTVNNCGTVYTSINSGLWRQPGTWNNNAVPTVTTNVDISGGKNVTIDAGATCKNLNIGTNDTLTIVNGGNLVVDGDFTIDGNLSLHGVLNMVGGIITFTKPKTCIPGVGALYHIMYLKTTTPDTIFLCDDIRVKHTLRVFNGTVMNDNGNTAEVKGTIINNSYTVGTGTVKLRANSGNVVIQGDGTYTNLDIDTGGASIYSNLTVNGTLNLIADNLVIQNGYSLTVGNTSSSASNISSSGGTIVGGSSSITALLRIKGNSSAPQIANLPVTNIGNIYIDRPAGVRMGMNLSVRRQIDLINGNLDLNGYNLTLGGLSTSNAAATNPGGYFINSGSTGTFYIYGNSSASAITSLALDTMVNFTVSLPAGLSLGNSFYAKNLISLISGKVDLNDQEVRLGASASISETPGSVFNGNGGKITTTRTYTSALSNNNIAGMGGKFTTSSSPGTTIIERGPSSFTSGSGNSIKRYFNFKPSNNQTITLELNYDSTELNGANRSLLRMNRSTNNGLAWTTLTGGSRTTASSATGYVVRSSISVTSAGAWLTASDSVNSPLSPVFVIVPSQIHANATKQQEKNINYVVSVYPNPFRDEFTIDMDVVKGIYTLQLVDMAGKSVYSQSIETSEGNTKMVIPTSQLTYGVYTLNVMSVDGIQTIRVIKQ